MLHTQFELVHNSGRYDVEVRDFGKSWRSGLAFLALIKSINPALVDMRTSLTKTQQENVEEAFRIAHNILGIPSLLDFQGNTYNNNNNNNKLYLYSTFHAKQCSSKCLVMSM